MIYGSAADIPADILAGWKDRWPNFPPSEPYLACPCCGEICVDEHALDLIQAARNALGKPIRLNSGHRCWLRNALVGGVPQSQHKQLAFDINLHGHYRMEVYEACLQAGFTTFGFYLTFLHTDPRPGRRWYGSMEAKKLWNF